MFGLNCDSGLALVQNQSGPFDLAKFGAELIRFPGGTWGNFYDWRTGWARPGYVEWADAAYSNGKHFNLDDLLRHFQPSQKVLWTLNPLTDSLLSNLDFLHAAKAKGFTVEYIEIGNELYQANCPDCARVWPDGKIHASEMTQWVTAIHREFPGAKVAVTGSADTGGRCDGWNEALADTEADALTLHPYCNLRADALTAWQALEAWHGNLQRALSTVPAGLDVWVTEYGCMDVDWATGKHGSAVGTQTQAWVQKVMRWFMGQEPRIKIAILHSLCGIGEDKCGLYNGANGEPFNGLTETGTLML